MQESLQQIKGLYVIGEQVQDEKPRLSLFLKRLCYERLYKVYFELKKAKMPHSDELAVMRCWQHDIKTLDLQVKAMFHLDQDFFIKPESGWALARKDIEEVMDIRYLRAEAQFKKGIRTRQVFQNFRVFYKLAALLEQREGLPQSCRVCKQSAKLSMLTLIKELKNKVNQLDSSEHGQDQSQKKKEEAIRILHAAISQLSNKDGVEESLKLLEEAKSVLLR